jgi:hypothetical protein
MMVFKRFSVLILSLSLFLLPSFALAAPIREVSVTQPITQSPVNNKVSYSGYTFIHGGVGTLKIRARLDEVQTGNSILPSGYLVNKLAPIANHHYTFSGSFQGLTPGYDYVITFFHDGSPVEDLKVINFTFQPTPVVTYTPPNVKFKKPGGTYGANNELDYTAVGTKIDLKGVLQSDRTEQLDLKIDYVPVPIPINADPTSLLDPSTVHLTGPGVFSQVVTANQDYPFNVTLTGLTPNTKYAVGVGFANVTAPYLWFGSITMGPLTGPYGTTVVPTSSSHIQFVLQGEHPTTTGYTRDIQATALQSGTYGAKIAWGSASNNLMNLSDQVVLSGTTTNFVSTLMNTNDVKLLQAVISSLQPNTTYWFTLVNPADPYEAYFAPVSFTTSASGGGGGGGNSGGGGVVGPSAPLVGPGNLVPCDGTAWLPCKFSHLMQLANNVIKFIIILAIPIAAVGFVYIGYVFIAKGGSEEAKGKAKKVAGSMVVGLIAILAGWLGVNLILDSFLDNSDPANPASDYKLLDQQ